MARESPTGEEPEGRLPEPAPGAGVTRPGRFVLVMGTGFTNRTKREAARRTGAMLSAAGFGLVTGNSTGVDRWAAEVFCTEQQARGVPLPGTFVQVALTGLRFIRRGGMPLPGYRAPAECRVAVSTVEAWKREALARSHAVIMIGGGRGALDLARRAIERQCPVFPLPFMGGMTGNSDFVFQKILERWSDLPVPGLSRTQYLRLAEPWIAGTGPLEQLLHGTLAETPDVFISYRRSDASAASGRLARDLAEHFGHSRVFLDIDDIVPASRWQTSIEDAIRLCKAGVVVIGPHWLAPDRQTGRPRLCVDDDPVRREIVGLIDARKAVFPVLVESARLPEEADLPRDLRPLLRLQTTSITNRDWHQTVDRLVRAIEAVIRNSRTGQSPGGAGGADMSQPSSS
jgi:predicted Rossmann-fold nucleotide-binding protein